MYMIKKLTAILLAGMFLLGICGSCTASGSGAVSTGTVTVNGREIDYAVFGEGPETFIILPGLSVHSVAASADAVAAAYEAFAEHYTVYLFDVPRELPDGYASKDLAEDTAAAMKALGIENADIFGVSQGGMIAMLTAISHPELARRLILGSTLAKPNETFEKLVDEWTQFAEEKNEDGLLASFADNIYSGATLEMYRDYIISSNRGISDAEYRRFLILAKADRSFDCFDDLPLITCPVLILGSEGDRAVTAEGSRQIAEALPQAELFLYDETYGHAVYDEAPDYKQRCLDFLLTEDLPG